MFKKKKKKTKDNVWEQIIVTYAKERIKELNLIGRWWINLMGGEQSSLILVACQSRKMGPSFKAKSEGSQVRCGVQMSTITMKGNRDTWETLGHSVGSGLSSLVCKASYCRG